MPPCALLQTLVNKTMSRVVEVSDQFLLSVPRVQNR